MIDVETVRKLPRFSGLTPEAHKWLSERLSRKFYEKGKFLFLEGEDSSSLYLIERGAVKVFRSLESGRELILGLFRYGDAIGEVALIDGNGYPASASAHEDSTVLLMRREDYFYYLKIFDGAAIALLRDLMMRMRTMQRRMEDLGGGGVEFRLGRVLPNPKGPGIVLVFSPIDRMVRVSLRVETLEVPPQDVITRDNVTVKVNAVIYFRVIDPTKAVIEVANFLYATSQLAQTTLRSVLGEVDLDELLSQREKLNLRLQSVLDQHTGPWGVKVSMVEVKQVDLAEQMIRAIARQAEAERERRAKVIHAEGEFMAAERLAMAAELIQKQPAAIQLRYLQTLVEIGQEKNTTVVFPLPIDIFSAVRDMVDRVGR